MARKKNIASEEGESVEVIGETISHRGHRGTSLAVMVLSMLLALALGIAGYFYYQYTYNTPQKKAERETQAIVSDISRFMVLPEGEPTVATVTDKTKLADQDFFKKAENNDKILIYTSGNKAILYRPSAGKVIDVTTINVMEDGAVPTASADQIPAPQTTLRGTSATTPAPPSENTPVVTTTPTLALYNGSSKIGATNTLEDEIKTKFPDVEVVMKDKAVRNDYQGNIIIDLSGKYADFAQQLADSFSGTIGTLPEDETAPEAGILIIIGNKP